MFKFKFNWKRTRYYYATVEINDTNSVVSYGIVVKVKGSQVVKSILEQSAEQLDVEPDNIKVIQIFNTTKSDCKAIMEIAGMSKTHAKQ